MEEVLEARRVARVATSLDRRVGELEANSLGSLIPSCERGPEEELDISLREDALRRAVDQLPEPQRQVVKLRYGINGDEPSAISTSKCRGPWTPSTRDSSISEVAEGVMRLSSFPKSAVLLRHLVACETML